MANLAAGIIILGLIVLVMAVMIINENRNRKASFRRWVERSWGKAPTQEYSAEAFESIRHFSDRKETGNEKDGAHYIDDITWHDSDLDSIYLQINNTVSSPGEDVLYSWMRHPCFKEEELKRRSALMDYFGSHEKERMKVQYALSGVGRMRTMSFYDYIVFLKQAKHVGKMKFILLGLLSVAGIVMIFISPLAALAILLPALFINLYVYLHMRDSTQIYIRSFQCILCLLNGAKSILKLDIPELADYTVPMKETYSKMASFGRGAFLVTSGGQVGMGIGDALLEYLKMIFHIDLIKFDQMLDSYEGHEEDCMRLIELLGSLDAAVACASFRNYLPAWCRGEFSEFPSENEAGVRLEIEDMYHPLISNPVANSIKTKGGNLVTGSNASGKSTFLKNIAICVVMAQSIDTVPARVYKAPFLRLYTSMALSDNLGGGESYFIVEIKSLKRILDAAKENPGMVAAAAAQEAPGMDAAAAQEKASTEESDGRRKDMAGSRAPVLGIIDEVLRGTNTIERIAASSQILSALDKPNVITFAATHDIELSYILESKYCNWHFEEEVKENDVIFNYQLRGGRATTRNAIKLLGIAGYDPDVVEAAQTEAEVFEKTGEWKPA